MESLKPPIREAMKKDPDLLHKTFSLEALITLAGIKGRRVEVEGFWIQYSELSTEAKTRVEGEEKER
jgi:hypothetical protein